MIEIFAWVVIVFLLFGILMAAVATYLDRGADDMRMAEYICVLNDRRLKEREFRAIEADQVRHYLEERIRETHPGEPDEPLTAEFVTALGAFSAFALLHPKS